MQNAISIGLGQDPNAKLKLVAQRRVERCETGWGVLMIVWIPLTVLRIWLVFRQVEEPLPEFAKSLAVPKQENFRNGVLRVASGIDQVLLLDDHFWFHLACVW